MKINFISLLLLWLLENLRLHTWLEFCFYSAVCSIVLQSFSLLSLLLFSSECLPSCFLQRNFPEPFFGSSADFIFSSEDHIARWDLGTDLHKEPEVVD